MQGEGVMKIVDIEGFKYLEEDWLIKARKEMQERLRIENEEYLKNPKPWEVLSMSFIGCEYKKPINITHVCAM